MLHQVFNLIEEIRPYGSQMSSEHEPQSTPESQPRPSQAAWHWSQPERTHPTTTERRKETEADDECIFSFDEELALLQAYRSAVRSFTESALTDHPNVRYLGM
jgi:hypothetical protein